MLRPRSKDIGTAVRPRYIPCQCMDPLEPKAFHLETPVLLLFGKYILIPNYENRSESKKIHGSFQKVGALVVGLFYKKDVKIGLPILGSSHIGVFTKPLAARLRGLRTGFPARNSPSSSGIGRYDI